MCARVVWKGRRGERVSCECEEKRGVPTVHCTVPMPLTRPTSDSNSVDLPHLGRLDPLLDDTPDLGRVLAQTTVTPTSPAPCGAQCLRWTTVARFAKEGKRSVAAIAHRPHHAERVAHDDVLMRSEALRMVEQDLHGDGLGVFGGHGDTSPTKSLGRTDPSPRHFGTEVGSATPLPPWARGRQTYQN